MLILLVKEQSQGFLSANIYTHISHMKYIPSLSYMKYIPRFSYMKYMLNATQLSKSGGGGQPHFATAGGKDVDGLSAAVDKVISIASQTA